MKMTRIDGKLVEIDTDMKELKLETNGNASSSSVKYLNSIKPDDIEQLVGEKVGIILYNGQAAKIRINKTN